MPDMPESSMAAIETKESLQVPAGEITQPLADFYALSGSSLPEIEEVATSHVPEPYRTLLVHQSDMTSTLERFHRQPILIRVLSRKRHGDFYYREVLLVTHDGTRVVEFGAIKINLSLFPEKSRQAILAESLPLGTILNTHGLAYSSRPKACWSSA